MIRRMGAGFLALLIVLGGGLYLYLRSALPQTDGRIVVSWPKAEIRIERDADGVPLITAEDDEDVAFGLGFVHAQERLFQMELQRRYGAGRPACRLNPRCARYAINAAGSSLMIPLTFRAVSLSQSAGVFAVQGTI